MKLTYSIKNKSYLTLSEFNIFILNFNINEVVKDILNKFNVICPMNEKRKYFSEIADLYCFIDIQNYLFFSGKFPERHALSFDFSLFKHRLIYSYLLKSCYPGNTRNEYFSRGVIQYYCKLSLETSLNKHIILWCCLISVANYYNLIIISQKLKL